LREKPTKQRNVIIAIVVCGAVLVAVIIGAVAGVVSSQKRKYLFISITNLFDLII
jgi:hypothetical protein